MGLLVVVNEARRTGVPLGVLTQLGMLQDWGVDATVHLKRGGPLVDEFRRRSGTVSFSPPALQRALDAARFRGVRIPRNLELRVARRAIAACDPDAILVESAACIEFAVAASQLGFPCLLHAHEVGSLLDTLWWPTPQDLAQVAVAAPTATACAELAPRLGPSSSLHLLRSPIDLEALRERATSATSHRPAQVVGCGLAAPIKGADRFVELALQLAPEGISSAWLGDGPSRRRLQREVARRGGSRLVELVGDVPDPASWLASADVVVIPSRSESMSRVAVEALALGTPVVATSVGALPEVVDGGGLLVDAGDADALVDAVRSLVYDPAARDRIGEAGRRHAEQVFGLDAFATEFARLLQQLGVGNDKRTGPQLR